MTGVILFCYLILALRLWHEQIMSFSQYDSAVEKQTIRRIRQPAVRGRIITDDAYILADNIAVYNIVFDLSIMRQPGYRSRTIDYIVKAAERIGHIIGRSNTLITPEKINAHINYKPALPMTAFKSLTGAELAKVAEMTPAIPGMDIITIPVRRYKYGKTACHIIGYIRKDDPAKAQDKTEYFYYIPDERGKTGLEKAYDESITEGDVTVRGLRGTPGNSLVRVDFRGYVYETVGNSIQAQLGHDIVLTLNFKAQRIAEKLMRGKRGAFVLLDASTGAVLAMVSSPEYDLSKFVPRLSPAYYNSLIHDPDDPSMPNRGRPLFNKALNGTYEPGSIIKPLIALALLKNEMPQNETVFCSGRSYIGKRPIRCASWRRGGHGSLNLVGALEQSCNVFFIEEGRVLGVEKIAETLALMGIGQDTEFILPNKKALLPSREGKFRRSGTKWTAFDTALISIGQGEVTVTPLQVALYMAAIANGGTLWQPYLLKEVLDEQGNSILIHKPHARAELDIPEKFLDLIREGMSRVVRGRNGSGKRGNAERIKIYGKTGTAQKESHGVKGQNTWFAGYGIKGEKKYSFAVFVEDGSSGGRTCAPIAKDFFDTWLAEEGSASPAEIK